MEFKFQATDEKPSTSLPPSPGISYFSAHALRGGSNNDTQKDDGLRNLIDLREEVQRELEKERIRQVIIAEEIVRRRLLEAEVRRELMLEREIALLRAGGFPLLSSSSLEPSTVGFAQRLPSLHLSEGKTLGERLTFPFRRETGPLENVSSSLQQTSALRLDQSFPLPHQSHSTSTEDRLGFPFCLQIGALEKSPFQRLPDASAAEVKPLAEVSKDKVILLAKPVNPIQSGDKRKALTTAPAEGGGTILPSAKLNKKPKIEWSCALCQVSATSQRGLDEHLQGKKHKSMEASLKRRKNINNCDSSSFPLKTINNSINTSTPSSGQKLWEKEKVDESSMEENTKLMVQIKEKGGGTTKRKVGAKGEKTPLAEEAKRKFKFWCEICGIGAHNQKVFNDHKEGKKHLAQLEELNNKSAAAPTITEPKVMVVAELGATMTQPKVVVTQNELNHSKSESATTKPVQKQVVPHTKQTENAAAESITAPKMTILKKTLIQNVDSNAAAKIVTNVVTQNKSSQNASANSASTKIVTKKRIVRRKKINDNAANNVGTFKERKNEKVAADLAATSASKVVNNNKEFDQDQGGSLAVTSLPQVGVIKTEAINQNLTADMASVTVASKKENDNAIVAADSAALVVVNKKEIAQKYIAELVEAAALLEMLNAQTAEGKELLANAKKEEVEFPEGKAGVGNEEGQEAEAGID